jgi:hypothetical protein
VGIVEGHDSVNLDRGIVQVLPPRQPPCPHLLRAPKRATTFAVLVSYFPIVMPSDSRTKSGRRSGSLLARSISVATREASSPVGRRHAHHRHPLTTGHCASRWSNSSLIRFTVSPRGQHRACFSASSHLESPPWLVSTAGENRHADCPATSPPALCCPTRALLLSPKPCITASPSASPPPCSRNIPSPSPAQPRPPPDPPPSPGH